MSTPTKVGGTKHRASPPLQKVGGACPRVHPRIYTHASWLVLVIDRHPAPLALGFMQSADLENMYLVFERLTR